MSNYIKETKSGFVNSIISGFDKFVKVFKKHGMLTVTFILILFLIFYSFILHPLDVNQIVTDTLHREEKIKVEQKEEHMQQRLESDKMINELMDDVMDRYNEVNRIIVFEAHNSTTNISNVPFLYYSAIYEKINTKDITGEDVYSLDYVNDIFQKQNISNFIGNNIFQQLKHSHYLYFHNLENYHKTEYRFISKMRDIVGSESIMIIPCISGDLPQVLIVISSKEPELPVKDLYDTISKYIPQIEKNLMNVG